MVITITHTLKKGYHNPKEVHRLSRINRFIADYLTSYGITADVASFNGLDEWQITGNLPNLAKQLKKYPTVSII